MANPTFDDGVTTLTFKPGNIQARRLTDTPRQRKQVSSSLSMINRAGVVALCGVWQLKQALSATVLPFHCGLRSRHGLDPLGLAGEVACDDVLQFQVEPV